MDKNQGSKFNHIKFSKTLTFLKKLLLARRPGTGDFTPVVGVLNYTKVNRINLVREVEIEADISCRRIHLTPVGGILNLTKVKGIRLCGASADIVTVTPFLSYTAPASRSAEVVPVGNMCRSYSKCNRAIQREHTACIQAVGINYIGLCSAACTYESRKRGLPVNPE
jgi:hypothetical protein